MYDHVSKLRCRKFVRSIRVACSSTSVYGFVRGDGEIKVDGVLAGGEWSDALRLELNMETDPAENEPAPVKTTAFLIEDGENLYVAFAADDPNSDNRINDDSLDDLTISDRSWFMKIGYAWTP